MSYFTYQELSVATNKFARRLGGGGFGSVFQGALVTGAKVAVKRLELGDGRSTPADLLCIKEQMRTEVQVLSHVQHPNVVQLLGWSNDAEASCLVYALMQGGSLKDRLACHRYLVYQNPL